MVGTARRRNRILCRSRGDVGGKAPPLQQKVKIEVERREKAVVCTASKRIRNCSFRRGDIRGKAPTVQENVKMGGRDVYKDRWVGKARRGIGI